MENPTEAGLYQVNCEDHWGPYFAMWNLAPDPHWRSMADRRMPDGRVTSWRGPLVERASPSQGVAEIIEWLEQQRANAIDDGGGTRAALARAVIARLKALSGGEQAAAWCEVRDMCFSLGMQWGAGKSRLESVTDFIRGLHANQQPEPVVLTGPCECEPGTYRIKNDVDQWTARFRYSWHLPKGQLAIRMPEPEFPPKPPSGKRPSIGVAVKGMSTAHAVGSLGSENGGVWIIGKEMFGNESQANKAGWQITWEDDE